MKKKVLVVDDERAISDVVKYNLEKEGYEVLTAYDGEEAIEKAMLYHVDLILLDVMLPKYDGFHVCRKIRESRSMPIIMLTAKEEEVDKVLGFELGADDYITKPFGIRELMARVKANLRRIEINSQTVVAGSIEIGPLVIDNNRHVIFKNGEPVDLTHREFELVKFLAMSPNHVFTRENLLHDVWGYEYYGDPRTVDVTIRRVREKLEVDSSEPSLIMTKRGVGYYFND